MCSPVIVKLTGYQIDIAKQNGKKAEVGGSSNIYQGNERKDNLSENQFFGQLATVGYHLYYYGHLVDYVKDRTVQNKFPHFGDGGSDVIGANVDVKGSKYRYKTKSLDEHKLLVRPKEYKQDTVYVQALVDYDEKGECAVVYLNGWATGKELQKAPTKPDEFGDAYRLEVGKLHPLPPIRFSWLMGA